MDITVIIFLLVYLALALGYLPGFRVDRTGAAVVGALAMIGFGRITDKQAWDAIDYQTVGLLFGLMIVSGAFTVSGFYQWLAGRVASLKVSPPELLAFLVVTGGGLSALLTNDVVIVAMTPLLVSITMSRGLNPVPFLLGFCFATNTGSVATIIGSPQNMIAAQTLGLSFTGFMKVALVPAVISLPVVWGAVCLIYRRRWNLAAVEEQPPSATVAAPAQKLDIAETIKAAIVTVAVVAAFVFTDWPREMVALSAAAVMLVNRQVSSKEVIGTVDGNLLLLLAGLFVVNAALAQTGMPQKVVHDLQSAGVDFANPSILFLVASALSNIVGNNPAVMLLAPFLPHAANTDALGAALALGTGFSSNLIIFGSLAGIIVVEQAKDRGVKIGMGEFCRAGVPVTLLCMVLALAWIAFLT
ncbi:SLC13 family permease [Martelella sp. AD-3]|uniref:SLC13 family permease n=1 Tax=Martelella sp. AD-3 TaxID=686597 RepID=UPI000465547A|nr:SLC13 family permease [Martelella sp. AD-3]AMM86597.1 transporter [Martelella sp. AD-3]